MKRFYWFSIVLVVGVLTSCARGVPEPQATPLVDAGSATPTPQTTATPLATEAAFTSGLPTPWPTPTDFILPTPWPTATPLPSTPPRLPAGQGPAIGWMQPTGPWRGSLGGSSPRAWRFGNLALVNGASYGGSIDAYSISDGDLVWRYPIMDDSGRPVYVNAVVGVDGAIVLQLGHDLLALDASSGQPIWSVAGDDGMSLLAASSDALYLVDYNTIPPTELVAVDAATGQQRWRHDCLPGWETPLYPAGDWVVVACLDDAGLTSLAQLTASTGDLVRLLPVPDEIGEVLGYQDGVFLFTTRPTPPIVEASENRLLTALDWASGQLLWQAYLTGPDKALVDGDSVVLAAGNQLQRRDLRSGNSLWVATLPEDDRGLLVSQAVRSGDALIVGSNSGILYAFDRASGDLLWQKDLWQAFDLPWAPVGPLDASDDTLLVWMSTADGSAIAALRQGPGLSAWPTPTFLPDEALAWDMPAPLPTLNKTPQPPDWTPQPVAWVPGYRGRYPDAEQQMEELLLTWLDLHPRDYEGFNRLVSQWPPQDDPETGGPGTYSYPADFVSWVRSIDLDGDGRAEDVLAYGLEQKSWAVLQNDDQGVTVVQRQIGQFNEELPQIQHVGDLNCDSQSDLAVQILGGNSMMLYLRTEIGQWDGSAWRDLGAIYSSGVSPEHLSIDFRDLDGDGCLEAIATDFPSHMAVTRLRNTTYAFQEGRFRPVETRGTPSHLSYFRLIDANVALSESDLDRALELAVQALEAPLNGINLHMLYVDEEPIAARIATYAAIEAMLVHALRDEAPAMRALLDQVEARYDRADNSFLPAARILWQTFDATGDALAACQAMERAVRLRGDTLLLRYASEQLETGQFCPLD